MKKLFLLLLLSLNLTSCFETDVDPNSLPYPKTLGADFYVKVTNVINGTQYHGVGDTIISSAGADGSYIIPVDGCIKKMTAYSSTALSGATFYLMHGTSTVMPDDSSYMYIVAVNTYTELHNEKFFAGDRLSVRVDSGIAEAANVDIHFEFDEGCN